MKTGITHSLHHHFLRGPFAALQVALACAVTASTCIAAVNTPPTGQDLFIATVVNVPASIVLAGTDVDGDPLTFTLKSSPLHGFLSGTAPNLTYTPQSGFVGLDGFNYAVSDGLATSVLATVTINVKYGLSITPNLTVTEGNGGTTSPTIVTFTITKSGVSADPASFSLHLVDGTARVGSDYLPINFAGVTIQGDQTSVSLQVPMVIGDRLGELSESFLVQLLPSFNAAIVSGTCRCTIRDDDALLVKDNLNIVCCATIGTAELTPENSLVEVGERTTLSLGWTHPIGWRKLDSVDLLISGDEGTVLHARWHEAANAFSLLNSAADKFLHIGEAGSPARLETSVAALHLKESTGGGPPGQTVTIDFSLSFKPQAAGRTFSIEAFAADDAGNGQGFESVGTVTVLPH
jgi:hypothetical protein